MKIHVSEYGWADGKTIWCYAWKSHEDVRSYTIDIKEAKRLYPQLTVHQAVKIVARKRFQKDCELGGER